MIKALVTALGIMSVSSYAYDYSNCSLEYDSSEYVVQEISGSLDVTIAYKNSYTLSGYDEYFREKVIDYVSESSDSPTASSDLESDKDEMIKRLSSLCDKIKF